MARGSLEFTHKNKGFKCSQVDCDHEALSKGLCNGHYLRMKASKPLDGKIKRQEKNRICRMDGCGKPHYGNDLCDKHWRTWNRQNIKLKLIKELGGVCSACKKEYHYAAFDFHHLNPKLKSFSITDKIQNTSYDKLLEEAKKCILLCANCHRIEHAGDLI